MAWSYNRGKRSVVLDLDTAADRDKLLGLVDGADFVIESADPGAMAAPASAPTRCGPATRR